MTEASGDRPSPARVSYDVRDLFREIRSELHEMTARIVALAEQKADKSDVQNLEQRLYVVETMGSRHAQDLERRVGTIETGSDPYAQQLLGEHRTMLSDVAQLKTEKAERGAVDRLGRRIVAVGLTLAALIVAAAGVIVSALK